MPKVLNKHKDGTPEGSVYIGRPSQWGNPFVIGKDGTREEVIAKYRKWFLSKPQLVESAKVQLAGKDLVCFCAPQACHGDVLLEVANMELNGMIERSESMSGAGEAGANLSDLLGVAVEDEMTLPYDYARCAGTTHPTCQWCRRREPGREQWQIYIVPPIDTMTGECSNFIEPQRTCVSNNTTPNVELSGRRNRRDTAQQRRLRLSSDEQREERA